MRYIFTLTLVAAASLSWSQVQLSSGHLGLGIGYGAEGWDPHIHDHDNNTEYAPDEAYLYYGTAARANRPVSAAYDFIGVAAGAPIWRNYTNTVPNIPWLDFDFEEIAPGTFDSFLQTDPRLDPISGEWVDVNLISFSGPGQVSFFQGGGTSPTVWFATSDGISSSDKFISAAGGHDHGSFTFTQAGVYSLTFQASAMLNGTRVYSDNYTYRFGVEQAVPEPASMIALGAGVLALLKRKRSR